MQRGTGVVTTLILGLTLAVSSGLGGCGLDTRTEDLMGPWFDGTGHPVRNSGDASAGLEVVRDPSGCGVSGVIVLLLAWPVGGLAGGSTEIRQYARDPGGRLGDSSGGRFAADVALPRGAVDTGFSSLGNRLFVDTSSTSTGGDAYVRRPAGQVERWPRLTPDLACI